jgi:heptosyltransferase III
LSFVAAAGWVVPPRRFFGESHKEIALNSKPKHLLAPEYIRDRLEKSRRLLIIRLRSLGDSILALPLLQALHSWRPELELDVLVESSFFAVFSNHPAVHETLVLRPRKDGLANGWSRLRAIAEIRNRRYPAVLDLHGGSTARVFTFWSGAGLRIGQEYLRSRVYNAGIPASSTIWNVETLHTAEHQLAIMRWLGLPLPDNLHSRLHLSPEARRKAEARLLQSGLEWGNYFLIHPTATLATKQWAPANFAAIGDALALEYRIPVIYTSGPRESQVLLDIGRHSAQRHRYWSDLDLADLFALIQGCRLFIGNDSGPTHAAAALEKPVVVLWGSSNHHAWHPWETDYELVRSDLPCMPCSGYSCAEYGEPRCILDLPVDRVRQACHNILARSGDPTRTK